MMNNDVLRSVRYMLSINNAKMVEIIKLDDFEVAVSAMDAYVIKEGEPGYEKCPDEVMAHFLNGPVFFKRGKDDKFPAPAVELPITNNGAEKAARGVRAERHRHAPDLHRGGLPHLRRS